MKSLPIRQFLLANLTRPPGSEYLQFRIPIDILESSLQAVGGFPFKNTDEVSYAGPSLFVRGTKSHYVPDLALPLIRIFFPRSELHDIDCGHWVISEQAEAFRKGKNANTNMCKKDDLTVLVVVGFIRQHSARSFQ